MQRSVWTGLGAMALVLTAVSFGGLATAELATASARYPQDVHVLAERVDLGSLLKGYISESGSYRTADPLADVAAWYMSRYRIEPGPGAVSQGQCVRLAKVNGYYLARQALVVSLCPNGRGTQVDFNQTLYLWP